MTVQFPDDIASNCELADFGELSLYVVTTGDITANNGWGVRYPFRKQPSVPADSITCSALWRGYIAEYAIHNDGQMSLVAYRYPLAPSKPRVEINERLVGDFWLVMKSRFEGERVYVPFRAGVLVSDENEWHVEGNEALASQKHPPPIPTPFEPQNIPLERPVFVGIVSEITFYDTLGDEPWIVVDRDIPTEYRWCNVQLRRKGEAVLEVEVGASSGGSRGPWLLDVESRSAVQVGDQVWVTERSPTETEIETQLKEANHQPGCP